MPAPFPVEQRFEVLALCIAESHPREVEELVGEDTSELAGLGSQFEIQDDAPLSNESSGIDGLSVGAPGIQLAAAGAQRRTKSNTDGATMEKVQAAAEPINGQSGVGAVFEA